MAKVTIETHNVTTQATSGRSTFQVSYSGCTAASVVASAGTMSFTSLSLNASGYIVAEWQANTSTAERATFIIVTANVTGGGTVKDVLAFNQLGTGAYSANISGPRDLEGDMGSGTYTISTGAGGRYGAYSDSSWLSVESVTKTGVAQGNMVLSWDRNNGDARYGLVRFVLDFDLNPYRAYYFMVITQGTYVTQESSLSYNPNTAAVGYNAGTYTSAPAVMSNVTSLTVRNVSGSMDITSVDIDSNSGALVIVYGANNGSTNLDATITVRGMGTNGYITTSFYLTQGTYKFAVNPIWQTTTVDVAGLPYVDYTVSTEGDVVYSGRAYQIPGTDEISFELNEICRDYVDNYLWWREGYQTPSGWQRKFVVEMSNGGGGDYVFTKDWSYVDLGYSTNSVICLNDPIIKDIPVGCFVPVCIFSPQRAGNTSFTRNGTSVYTVNLNDARQARYLFTSSQGYKYGYSGHNEIYRGAADCKTRYVLYYENAYGGIDAMPIQGNSLLTDKLTSYTMKNAVRVPSTSFSYRRYLNQITKSWQFHTSYLLDDQASKMHHLLESCMVYVWDIEEAKLFPVVIDESSVQYKTFKNQGRKFFNYSFTCRESQDKIRK